MVSMRENDIEMAIFHRVGFFGWMVLSSIEFTHVSVLYGEKRAKKTP